MQLHWRITTFASFVLSLLFTTSLVYSQPTPPSLATENLTGIWVGILYQGVSSTSTIFPFTMVLTQDGSQVSGTSFITLPDDPSTHGLIELSGVIEGDRFDFTETETLLETATNFSWCIKNGTLYRDGNGLSGSWESEPNCVPGRIALTKFSDDLSLLAAQNDETLNGIWVGILLERHDDAAVVFPFSMILSEKRDLVAGRSFIALSDDPSNYGIMELRGVFDGDQFDFSESRFVAESSEAFRDCIKSGSLSLGDLILTGNWEGDGDCSSGMIMLTRIRHGRYTLKY